MTTRINGWEMTKCCLASGGVSGMSKRPDENNRRENIHHAKLYSDLDKYFATEPGSKDAEKAIKRARRS